MVGKYGHTSHTRESCQQGEFSKGKRSAVYWSEAETLAK